MVSTNEGMEMIKMIAGEDLKTGDLVVGGSSDDEVVKNSSTNSETLLGVVYADADKEQAVTVIVRGVVDGVVGVFLPADGDNINVGTRLANAGDENRLSRSDITDASQVYGYALESVEASDSDETTTIKAFVDFVN